MITEIYKKDYINHQVIEFNNKNKKLLGDDVKSMIFSKDINLIHHVWRICLQLKDEDDIILIGKAVCNMQNPNGSWVDADGYDCLGITLVSIHRLIWSIQILSLVHIPEEVLQLFSKSISKAIDYTINHEKDIFNNGKNPAHGVIDNLHYLLMSYFYILKFNNTYQFCELNKIIKVEEIYTKNLKWLVEHQFNDGGWHELDRIRDRIGVTSDAARGLLLDGNFKKELNSALKFIISNQNPYQGYWSCGNVDKIFDAIKTLINSINVITDIKLIDEIECSVIKGIGWIINNYKKYMLLNENKFDLLTVFIDYEDIILNRLKPTCI